MIAVTRCALFLVGAGLSAVSSPVFDRSAAEVVAREMVRQAASAPWGQVYRKQPGCSRYSASGNTPFNAISQWSYACTGVRDDVQRTEYYYATATGSVTLQYLHLSLPQGAASPAAEDVSQAIERQLLRAYGRPMRAIGLAQIGCYRPDRPGQRWPIASSEIVLHGEKHMPLHGGMIEGPQIAVIERQRFALMQEDEELAREIGMGTYLRAAHLGSDRLQSEFPEYANLLKRPASPGAGRAKREAAARRAALQLLQQAAEAEPERRALLLVAADDLVERVADLLVDEHGAVAVEAVIARRQLRPFGAALGERMWDGGLSYNMDLLRRAATQAPGTEWGEIAFVRMLARGLQWRAYFVCEPVDQFNLVIEKGEAYLSAHPETRHRLEILFTLARAWETWWSVSNAPASDELTYEQFRPLRRRYLPRAEEARQKAIQYYEAVIQAAPESPEARSARRQLPRLKLGLDTGQRAFLCISC